MLIHDESGPSLACKIGPYPLQTDARAKVGLPQKLEMDCGPREPRDVAAYMDTASLQNGETLADYGHAALVEVAKRLGRRLAGQTPVDQSPDIATLLHRHLRHPR